MFQLPFHDIPTSSLHKYKPGKTSSNHLYKLSKFWTLPSHTVPMERNQRGKPKTNQWGEQRETNIASRRHRMENFQQRERPYNVAFSTSMSTTWQLSGCLWMLPSLQSWQLLGFKYLAWPQYWLSSSLREWEITHKAIKKAVNSFREHATLEKNIYTGIPNLMWSSGWSFVWEFQNPALTLKRKKNTFFKKTNCAHDALIDNCKEN